MDLKCDTTPPHQAAAPQVSLKLEGSRPIQKSANIQPVRVQQPAGAVHLIVGLRGHDNGGNECTSRLKLLSRPRHTELNAWRWCCAQPAARILCRGGGLGPMAYGPSPNSNIQPTTGPGLPSAEAVRALGGFSSPSTGTPYVKLCKLCSYHAPLTTCLGTGGSCSSQQPGLRPSQSTRLSSEACRVDSAKYGKTVQLHAI